MSSIATFAVTLTLAALVGAIHFAQSRRRT